MKLVEALDLELAEFAATVAIAELPSDHPLVVIPGTQKGHH